MSSQLSSEFLVSLIDRKMDKSHVVTDLLHHALLFELNVLEESSSDILKSLLGPVLEPINGGGIDKSGEHTSPNSEFRSNRGEA